MGFNSVVFICNDAMGAIEKDPKGWWQKTWEKLCRLSYGKTQEYGFGHHANGFEAVWNQHADAIGVIFVGGNFATVMGSTYGNINHSIEEQQIKILKDILTQKGYRVSITKKEKLKNGN